MKPKTDNVAVMNRTIKFIAELHKKGVYFWSLHFGDILVAKDGNRALIDISVLKVFPWSLTLNQSIRNWKHLFKYSFEKSIIDDYGCDKFYDEYAGSIEFIIQTKSIFEEKSRVRVVL
ncbi:MAG: hypothetical protein HFP77_09220 [Methylococcales symbiont of Iophon sp. n. MRB-2018]|nr:MAG: hypothetical protein HFP77_09220 [Methylococcales symbiont of Iophon sp. n. MRB-2018]KAF3978885.1 MAG: hypothetical protein HFP76_10405 [Methylococcales symbiont of Iophon sp. n. MRB-2018]